MCSPFANDHNTKMILKFLSNHFQRRGWNAGSNVGNCSPNLYFLSLFTDGVLLFAYCVHQIFSRCSDRKS